MWAWVVCSDIFPWNGFLFDSMREKGWKGWLYRWLVHLLSIRGDLCMIGTRSWLGNEQVSEKNRVEAPIAYWRFSWIRKMSQQHEYSKYLCLWRSRRRTLLVCSKLVPAEGTKLIQLRFLMLFPLEFYGLFISLLSASFQRLTWAGTYIEQKTRPS